MNDTLKIYDEFKPVWSEVISVPTTVDPNVRCHFVDEYQKINDMIKEGYIITAISADTVGDTLYTTYSLSLFRRK